MWGLPQSEIISFLDEYNDGIAYDIVFGSELMYYRTHVAALLSTVHNLTAGAGLFIHAHNFRSRGQDREILDILALTGWSTLSVSCEHFVSSEELGVHPDWFSVLVLISGPREIMEDLRSRHPEMQIFHGLNNLQ